MTRLMPPKPVKKDKHVAFPETRHQLRLDQKLRLGAWASLAGAVLILAGSLLAAVWMADGSRIMATGAIIGVLLLILAAILGDQAWSRSPNR